MDITRRDLLRLGAAGAAAGIAVGNLASAAPSQEAERRGSPGEHPVRTGFIGIGGRGTGLLKAYLKLDGQQVVAICDLNLENLERAATLVEQAQGEAPEHYTGSPDAFKEMLNRDDLHAVVMATPCYEHARMFLAAIEAGKHIYGEKPMALCVADANAIVSAAEANRKLVVQVGFQWMANPNFVDCIRRVHSGEIGEPIEGRFFRHNGVSQMFGWFGRREQSGDWMLEQACHEYNLMNWAAQATPLRAFGIGRRDLFREQQANRDVTDYYAVILEYPKNFIVHYAHGWISPDGFHEMGKKVIGSKGAVEIGGQLLRLRDKAVKPEPLREFKGDDTEEALRRFLESIRENKPVAAPVTFGRNATLTALLARKAVDERRLVTWEEMLQTC